MQNAGNNEGPTSTPGTLQETLNPRGIGTSSTRNSPSRGTRSNEESRTDRFPRERMQNVMHSQSAFGATNAPQPVTPLQSKKLGLLANICGRISLRTVAPNLLVTSPVEFRLRQPAQ